MSRDVVNTTAGAATGAPVTTTGGPIAVTLTDLATIYSANEDRLRRLVGDVHAEMTGIAVPDGLLSAPTTNVAVHAAEASHGRSLEITLSGAGSGLGAADRGSSGRPGDLVVTISDGARLDAGPGGAPVTGWATGAAGAAGALTAASALSGRSRADAGGGASGSPAARLTPVDGGDPSSVRDAGGAADARSAGDGTAARYGEAGADVAGNGAAAWYGGAGAQDAARSMAGSNVARPDASSAQFAQTAMSSSHSDASAPYGGMLGRAYQAGAGTLIDSPSGTSALAGVAPNGMRFGPDGRAYPTTAAGRLGHGLRALPDRLLQSLGGRPRDLDPAADRRPGLGSGLLGAGALTDLGRQPVLTRPQRPSGGSSGAGGSSSGPALGDLPGLGGGLGPVGGGGGGLGSGGGGLGAGGGGGLGTGGSGGPPAPVLTPTAGTLATGVPTAATPGAMASSVPTTAGLGMGGMGMMPMMPMTPMSGAGGQDTRGGGSGWVVETDDVWGEETVVTSPVIG
ncbi:MAG: hypothetical protein ACRCZD_13205 [Phycicoccus sp.]